LLSEIDEGDEGSIANMTITDVWVTPQRFNDNSGTHTFVRVQMEATQTNGELTIEDKPLRTGREFKINSDEFVVLGKTVTTGNSGSIATSQTQLTVTASVSADTALKISPGDTLKTVDQTVGTVKSVSVSGLSSTNPHTDKRVSATISVSAAEVGSAKFYGGQVVRPGESIPIQTGEYGFSGRIKTVGPGNLSSN
jgi:hypothetical protein